MRAREEIYAALFALLQRGLDPGNGGPLRDPVNRRYRPFTDCPIHPALCMMETGEDYLYKAKGIPAVRILHSQLYLYSQAPDDPTSIPGTYLNNLIDAVDAALRPSEDVEPGPGGLNDGEQTLGGKVRWVRIGGRVTIYEGAQATQATTVIQIDMEQVE